MAILPAPTVRPTADNLGVAPNVGGMLCYAPCCIGLIFSIVAAIVEKQSRFLRFHAFQSLLFHGADLVVVGVQIAVLRVSAVRYRRAWACSSGRCCVSLVASAPRAS